MPTFMQNIAPGIGSLAGGYIKGQTASLEKAREEERQAAKDALSTYTSLLKEGWKPVDPKKGSSTGEALQVGNIGWLIPPKVDEEFKYEFEREKMGFERERMTEERGKREEERRDLEKKRAFEEKIRGLQLESERAKTERAKVPRVTSSGIEKIVLTDKITGNKLPPMTRATLDQILTADPEELSPYDAELRKGVLTGRYEIGQPTAVTTKQMMSPADKMKARQRREQILINANDKENPPTEDEMNNYMREINDYLDDNETKYYFVKRTPGKFWGETVELAAYPLPTIPRKGATPSPATVRDVKEVMEMYNVDFQTAVSIIFNAVLKTSKGATK